MRRTIILILSLLLLTSVAYAALTTVEMHKGWNLVYGLADASRMTEGLSKEDIKAIYVYIPQTNSYAQTYPVPDEKAIFEHLTVEDLENSVYWVYSTKSGRAMFNVDEPSIPFEQRVLSKGWNFYPIVYEEMLNKKVSDFAGTCVIEKAYGFNAESQTWEKLDPKTTSVDKAGESLSLLIKVQQECHFGTVIGEIAPLPALPN